MLFVITLYCDVIGIVAAFLYQVNMHILTHTHKKDFQLVLNRIYCTPYASNWFLCLVTTIRCVDLIYDFQNINISVE